MPVGDDATSGCLSPSGHYNPFQVDVNVSFYITSNSYKCVYSYLKFIPGGFKQDPFDSENV